MGRIIISVEYDRFPTQQDKTFVIPIDFFTDVFESLDIPESDDIFTKMLCTAEVTIKRVTKSRDSLAKYLTPRIFNAIMDLLSANDTINGYPKEGI